MKRLLPWTPTLTLMALLVWVTLPFGSVTPTGRLIIRLGGFGTLALASLFARSKQRGSRLESALPKGAIHALAAFAGIGVLGWLQSFHWPGGVVSAVSPRHFELATRAGQLVNENASAISLSVAPALSRQAALNWLAFAAYFAAAVLVARRRKHRRALLAALLLGALLQLGFGLLSFIKPESEIFGVQVYGLKNRLHGTFINPNHLASYLELALACSFAWLAWGIWRLRELRTLAKWARKAAPPGVACIVLFLSLAATRSRAGLLAAILGVTIQSLILAWHRRQWYLATIGIVVLAAVAVMAPLSFRKGVERFRSTSYQEISTTGNRIAVFRATATLWKSFPLMGSGLGTFRESFPLVQPASVADLLWDHAHSDGMEFLATAGILGFGFLVFGLAALLRTWTRILWRGRRSEDQAAGLAGFGVLVAVGFHSFFDFGLQIPANWMTLAVIFGATASASTLTRGKTKRRKSLRSIGVARLSPEESVAAIRHVGPDARMKKAGLPLQE